MDFHWIWRRIKSIFYRPKAELEAMRFETGKMGETYFILLTLCILIGLSKIKLGISHFISETLIWFVASLLTTFATWIFVSKFGIKTTWAKSLKINSFAISPLLLCVITSEVIGYRMALLIIGFCYSVYLLFYGINMVFNPKDKETFIYTLCITLIGLLSNYIARVLIP